MYPVIGLSAIVIIGTIFILLKVDFILNIFKMSNFGLKYIRICLLIVIPLTFLVNVIYNNKTEFEQDPSFQYLFNGLNLTTHPEGVAMYPHPGTTVIEFSAIIMRITHLLRNTDDNFTYDVLKNPQKYIRIVVLTFAVINCVLLFFIGLFILKMTDIVVYGLLFQAIPAFSEYVIPWSFESLAPEPLIFSSTIIFIVLFLWRYYFERNFHSPQLKIRNKIKIDKFTILIGSVAGFCLVTKINTLPVIILPLVVIIGVKNRILYILALVLSFIFFTLPIRHMYRIMISWYGGVLTHTDLYGSGKAGFVDTFSIYQNFLETLSSEIFIILVMIISIIALLIQMLRMKFNLDFKMLAAMVLVQLINLFMVLKHFHLHYYIPILPTLAVNLFMVTKMYFTPNYIKTSIVLAFIVFGFYLNNRFEKYIPGLYDSDYPENGINIFSYKSKSPLYALKTGDDFSRNVNSLDLKKIYGDHYFYDITTKYITTWNDTVTLDSLFKVNDRIYLHALDAYMKELPPVFGIEYLSEGLYLVENKKCE